MKHPLNRHDRRKAEAEAQREKSYAAKREHERKLRRLVRRQQEDTDERDA